MTPEDQVFLRDFFRALQDKPLDPDDPKYIGLYEDPTLDLEDPVELLRRSIEWATSNTSAQLLSGFRVRARAPSCGACAATCGQRATSSCS